MSFKDWFAKHKAQISKFIDIVLITYSILIIAGLILLLYYSWGYWWVNFPWTYPRPARAFYVAVGIAIITIMAQWIEGRFRAILKIIYKVKSLKGGITEEEWKNSKKMKKTSKRMMKLEEN